MAKTTKTLTKEQTGRRYIGEFLAAMKYHDDDLRNTIKLMRKKLVEIQRRESAAVGDVMIKKPPTIRKIIFKFGGSTTCLPIVPYKRPHSETLVSGQNDAIETASASTHSKTLILKRKKIKNNNGDNKDDGVFVFKDSRTVSPVNPKFNETMINNNEGEGVIDFIKSVGGSGAELVIEKRLTSSDVTGNQGRLLIPVSKVNNQGFLTANEKMLLGNKHDISVCVFDPERRKLTLNIAKWKMSNEYYVLKTNWNQVVKINGLKEGMVIKVLSFRVQETLCFALEHVA